jgi:hypothetical protein
MSESNDTDQASNATKQRCISEDGTGEMDYFEELEHLDFYQADSLIYVVDNLAVKLA